MLRPWVEWRANGRYRGAQTAGVGHYLTFPCSEADAGYDRGRGGTDIAFRRPCRSGISKGGIRQTTVPTTAERGSSVSFTG